MNRCPHCGQNHSNTNHFCPVTGKPIELGPRLLSVKLLNRFKVVKILGDGPIGIVVEVEDKDTREHFAAKLIHPQYSRDAEAAKLMIADANRLKEVQCEHIAKVITVGRDTGAAILVVRELMSGHCLSTRIEQVGQFSIRAAFFIIREILVALDAIHSVGILNLDLSPGDVFLAKSNTGSTVKIVDIGEHHIKKTLTGKNLVSYRYFAPEQLDKSRQHTARADIFAAGAILHEMLTGSPPSSEPVPLESVRSDITPSVAALVAKALDPNPAKRFETAKEFIAAIDRTNEELTAIGSQPPAPVSAASAAQPATPEASPSQAAAVVQEAPAAQPQVQVAPEYQQAAAAAAPDTQAAPQAPVQEVQPPSRFSQEYAQAAADTQATSAPQEAPVQEAQEPRQGSQPGEASPAPAPQASVIVEMPEINKGVKSRKFLVAIVTVLVLAALATGYLINEKASRMSDEQPPAPQEVEISIEVVPQKAVISVDGKRMAGNPITMKVKPDTALHTILAKADGFEQKERDILFDRTRTIQLDLAEIIQPDEPAEEKQPVVAEVEAAAPAVEEVEPADAPPPPEPPPPEPPPPPIVKPKAPEPSKVAVKKPPQKTAPAKRPKTTKSATKKPRTASSTVSKPKTTKKSKKSEKSKVEGFRTANPFD